MKETLWEEENLTDRNQNLTTNVENVNLNTTTEIVTDSTKIGQKDTTINSGIYKIVNKINGKYYVGSSKFFENRWKKHRKMLRRHRHPNSHLQNAWNKYGKDAFEFLKIEFVKVELLLEIEQKYLDICKNDFESGLDTHYNISYVASAPTLGMKTKDSTKLKISNALKGRPMSNETKEKLSQSNRGQIPWCKGKTLVKDDRVFIWVNVLDGIHETCTRNELRVKYNLGVKNKLLSVIRGERPHHKGWSIGSDTSEPFPNT